VHSGTRVQKVSQPLSFEFGRERIADPSSARNEIAEATAIGRLTELCWMLRNPGSAAGATRLARLDWPKFPLFRGAHCYYWFHMFFIWYKPNRLEINALNPEPKRPVLLRQKWGLMDSTILHARPATKILQGPWHVDTVSPHRSQPAEDAKPIQKETEAGLINSKAALTFERLGGRLVRGKDTAELNTLRLSPPGTVQSIVNQLLRSAVSV
jgi:hypothetical protein